ncbi:uncharacterized protein EI90DRAFT_3051322 [Cantharellus anzutake]|uniref:uncharacterized protein n=1 Tax=Cantharellus anzutake TaxID=1750568 RepID=UPI0019041054|nr:uncharacterized protein EI90DRAFT_3051322 [Cantharellus anzutake]KAF8334167.1 hypothetical protein EI90DRAFT_3051322 [Cantharellus anzutake]
MSMTAVRDEGNLNPLGVGTADEADWGSKSDVNESAENLNDTNMVAAVASVRSSELNEVATDDIAELGATAGKVTRASERAVTPPEGVSEGDKELVSAVAETSQGIVQHNHGDAAAGLASKLGNFITDAGRPGVNTLGVSSGPSPLKLWIYQY